MPCGAALDDPRRVELPERVALGFVCEDDVGSDAANPRAERVVDERPGREVDRDARAVAGEPFSRRGSLPWRSALAAASSRRGAARRRQTRSRRAHRAEGRAPSHDPRPSCGRRQRQRRRQRPRGPRTGPIDLWRRSGELAGGELARRIRSALAHDASVGTEASAPRPRRSRPARPRRCVSSRRGRLRSRAGPSRCTTTSSSRSPRVVSLTVRSSHGRRRSRRQAPHVCARRHRRRRWCDRDAPSPRPGAPLGSPPRGLAAFEDAPCFLELVGDAAQRQRDAVEPAAGPSTRE